jgi:hypothetical protein
MSLELCVRETKGGNSGNLHTVGGSLIETLHVWVMTLIIHKEMVSE